MPKGPVDADLAKLLVPAPHVVPEKKAKKKAEHESRVQIEFIDEKDSPEPEPEVSPDGTPVKEKRITVEFRSDVPDKDRDTDGK